MIHLFHADIYFMFKTLFSTLLKECTNDNILSSPFKQHAFLIHVF